MDLFASHDDSQNQETIPSANPNSAQSDQESTLGAEEARHCKELADRMRARFAQGLVGQEDLRESLIITLVAGGHILIESVPGLAKTTAARILASCVSGSFKRIQCTPDLMPSDLIGTQIFDFASQKMITQIGPINANIVLLDEINRSSAKTQSAMLEAMAEGATTIGGEQISLPHPFMVIATQNPIEEEGTYALPEAQMDRFTMKTVMTYPTDQQEVDILTMLSDRGSDVPPTDSDPSKTISLDDVAYLRQNARKVHISDAVKEYIVDIVATSRGAGSHPINGLSTLVRLGASPRASIALMRVAQAQALLSGRDYVIPEDVKAYAHDVLRHRILMTFEALADGVTSDQIIDSIVETVPVP